MSKPKPHKGSQEYFFNSPPDASTVWPGATSTGAKTDPIAHHIASDTESDATTIRLHFENGKMVTMEIQGRAPIEIPPGVIAMEAIVDGKSAGTFTVPAGKSIVELNPGATK